MRLNGLRTSLRGRSAAHGGDDLAVIETGRPVDGLLEGMIRPSETGQPDPGPLPCGRRFGSPDPANLSASLIGDRGPRFDLPIAASGYSWWYIDAISDDGRHALTVIFFLGSVFSPYYARARRQQGEADPLNHCSVNICLYGAGGHRWAMTERPRAAMERTADMLVIGPSAVRWTGTALEIRLSEQTFPLPGRIRGTVRVYPRTITRHTVRLDAAGEHCWTPLAPDSRVEVDLSQPGLRWSGPGYFDSNSGLVPLEHSFVRWTWARAPLTDGTAVLYDVTRRDGTDLAVALRIGRDGKVEERTPPPRVPLPPGAWKVWRETRSEAGHPARMVEALEDTPFYTRSMVASRLFGENVTGVHESLCLDRFRSGWVQALLPFRMPRRFA